MLSNICVATVLNLSKFSWGILGNIATAIRFLIALLAKDLAQI